MDGRTGVEHLIKIETGTLRLLSKNLKSPDRNPIEKITFIRERLMDFETGMKAYGPILPNDKPKDKDKALGKLQDTRQRLGGLIKIHDLTEKVTVFDHPLFGTLTRIEWLYFIIYHGRRHVRQILNIKHRVSQQNGKRE